MSEYVEHNSAPAKYLGEKGSIAQSVARESSLYDQIIRLDPISAQLTELLSLSYRINGVISGSPPYGNSEKEVPDGENSYIARMFQKVEDIEEKVAIIHKQLERTLNLLGGSSKPR